MQAPLLSNGPTRRKIIFLHIPKVAGTSIRESIFKKIDLNMLWHSPVTPLHDQSFNRLADADIVGGHITLCDPMIRALEQKVGIDNCIYVAVFREPVSHLISHFHHIKKHPHHMMYSEDSLPVSLETQQAFFRGSKNLQTGYIARSRLASDAFSKLANRRFVISTLDHVNELSTMIWGLLGAPEEILSQENTRKSGGNEESNNNDRKAAEIYCAEHCTEDRILYEFVNEKKVWTNII